MHITNLRDTGICSLLCWLGIFSFLALGGLSSATQIPKIAEVPKDRAGLLLQGLTAERSELEARRDDLRNRVQAHNAKCTNVPVGSDQVQQCSGRLAALNEEMAAYSADVIRFNKKIEALPVSAEGCQAAVRQMQEDREAIARQARSSDLNQEELSEWTKRAEQSRVDAVKAAINLVLDTYVNDIDEVKDKVVKLQRRAAVLAQEAAKTSKAAAKARYAEQLNTVMVEWKPLTYGELWPKLGAQTAADSAQVWKLARNTMQDEFRVAAKKDRELHAVLSEPEFKSTFLGDDLNSPGEEVFLALADEAVKSLAKSELSLTSFARLTGPGVTAGVFVRDTGYAMTELWLSSDRVSQQDDLAGRLAQSALVLQKRYKDSVDKVHVCHSVGWLN